jgi:hypothetical protein
LSDDTLLRMDRKLAAGFLAAKKENQARSLQRASIEHSKMRVLDLLDVWLRREAHRSDSLMLIRPVLEVLTDMHHNGEKLVADRLTRVCLQRWGSVGVGVPA